MPDTALPDGTVLTESFWTPNVRQQVKTTCTSATRPTGVEGRTIFETDTDLEYTYNGTGWEQVGGVGGWTSFTPQIDQGASTDIAKTVNRSTYMRGPRRMITWSFTLTLTASGTAGSKVTVTLPVTAASTNGLIGVGNVFDASTQNHYPCTLLGQSTTTLAFQYSTTATNAQWGASPNLALASSDSLYGSITYEAAT